MYNSAPSTATPIFSTPLSTGSVDKKAALSCGNRVFHGFHRPYYYDHLPKGMDLVGSGGCAQLGARASYPAPLDLTHEGP